MDEVKKKSGDIEILFLVEQEPDEGYTARGLGVPIFTQADDLEALRKNIRDAVQCHYPQPENRPRIIRLHYVHEEVFEA